MSGKKLYQDNKSQNQETQATASPSAYNKEEEKNPILRQKKDQCIMERQAINHRLIIRQYVKTNF